MIKKISWIVFAVFAILIGLYPILYFIVDRTFGLLSSKSEVLLQDSLWNTGFYAHIVFGGFALLIGWIQFSKKLRLKNIKLHRNIGKLYVIAVLISGISGVYIGFFATGGIVSALGFISLGLIWLYTTVKAYITIRQKNIVLHQKYMIYSYAACFAAVTLRIWLPLLTLFFGEFIIAYKIVAWLCWMPNITVAYFITKKLKLA
jgi:uncharacterized membrane protein